MNTANIEERLYYQAAGLDKKYRHTNKENKQTTKLQDWLDENGKGIPPVIIKGMLNDD